MFQGFLERKSTTCTRFFGDLASSCTSEPALDAATYHNFRVLKVGVLCPPLQTPLTQITLNCHLKLKVTIPKTCKVEGMETDVIRKMEELEAIHP